MNIFPRYICLNHFLIDNCISYTEDFSLNFLTSFVLICFVRVAMQTGFGWSNGVVLAFLEEFGWPQDRRINC